MREGGLGMEGLEGRQREKGSGREGKGRNESGPDQVLEEIDAHEVCGALCGEEPASTKNCLTAGLRRVNTLQLHRTRRRSRKNITFCFSGLSRTINY